MAWELINRLRAVPLSKLSPSPERNNDFFSMARRTKLSRSIGSSKLHKYEINFTSRASGRKRKLPKTLL